MLNFVSILVIFAEPGFPTSDVASLPEIPNAIVCSSVEELARELQPGRVLVWRHGSTFPVEAWEPFMKFLDGGGSMLILGGEPFTRPVSGPAGARVVGPPSLAMLKTLYLNQSHRQIISGGKVRPVVDQALASLSPRNISESWAAVLEPRLSDVQNHPLEEGSAGVRDAVLRPLMHIFESSPTKLETTGSKEFPTAAAALMIDRLRGRWAGGRWVFWLHSDPPRTAELTALIQQASRPAVDFRIEPTLACFHEGEQPSLRLRLHRPHADSASLIMVNVQVHGTDSTNLYEGSTSFAAGEHTQLEVPLLVDARPGLYRVRAESEDLPTATTGFWVFDSELFSSGDPLTFDSYTLRRGGQPEPVMGTTMMSPTVHRQFLFEPDAAAWDDAFAELAALHVNLVRTGVWGGYRVISTDAGGVSETWLRALEAYYLSARRHDIPVMFTFFAFLPESFGGENPYLDPRAVEGQSAYVSAVARRFAPARQMLWDLINEPSFSSPNQIWKCRPNGDKHERQAFLDWLLDCFSPSGGDASVAWEARVRERWRLSPDEAIDLPALADFDAANVHADRRPYRAADYVHFAQDAFGDWCQIMRRAIRDSGSNAAITVGQDEGGLSQRPQPLFFHPYVEFTSMHTWWFNDALLYDGVAAKAGGKPLLISETGIMQRELLSGQAIRSPDDAARLLSRKIGYAFASDAFGVVQWCYDVNPYMTSNNEVAIGLRRADGSYKPEHRVFREFAAFVGRNRRRFESPRESEVVLILPSAESFSPRDNASAAIRRSVNSLAGGLGRRPRVVPDPRVPADLGSPKVIVLPANRGISEPAWQAIRKACQAGALLVCTGWFETTEVGLPANRLGLKARPLASQELIGNAGGPTEPGRNETVIRFPLDAVQSWYAAAGPATPSRMSIDGMNVWHHPLPLEWSESNDALDQFYAVAIPADKFGTRLAMDVPAGLIVQTTEFLDSSLVVAINETSTGRTLRLSHSGQDLLVPAGECRMAFLSTDGTRVLDTSVVDENL